jgi:hypothetical protein
MALALLVLRQKKERPRLLETGGTEVEIEGIERETGTETDTADLPSTRIQKRKIMITVILFPNPPFFSFPFQEVAGEKFWRRQRLSSKRRRRVEETLGST